MREYQIPDKPVIKPLNGLVQRIEPVPKIVFQAIDPDEEVEKEAVSLNISISRLTEIAREQLKKRAQKPIVKRIEEETEPSDYSDYGEADVNPDDELIPVVKFVGIMGQCFSNYKSYIKSLRRQC